jgi:hypothetical protein
MAVSLSELRAGRISSRGSLAVNISVRGLVDARDILWPEQLCQLKYPVT